MIQYKVFYWQDHTQLLSEQLISHNRTKSQIMPCMYSDMNRYNIWLNPWSLRRPAGCAEDMADSACSTTSASHQISAAPANPEDVIQNCAIGLISLSQLLSEIAPMINTIPFGPQYPQMLNAHRKVSLLGTSKSFVRC